MDIDRLREKHEVRQLFSMAASVVRLHRLPLSVVHVATRRAAGEWQRCGLPVADLDADTNVSFARAVLVEVQVEAERRRGDWLARTCVRKQGEGRR